MVGRSDRLAAAARSTDLRPIVATGIVAVALVALVGWRGDGDASQLATVVLPCLGLLAVTAAAVVDEAPADLLAASPTTSRQRLLDRLLVAVAAIVVASALLAAALVVASSGQGSWPWRTWVRDLVVLVLISVGIAAQGRRWFPEVPGGLLAVAVLAPLWLASALIPAPDAVADLLEGLPAGWLPLTAAALAIALAARATRDPAQVTLRARTR